MRAGLAKRGEVSAACGCRLRYSDSYSSLCLENTRFGPSRVCCGGSGGRGLQSGRKRRTRRTCGAWTCGGWPGTTCWPAERNRRDARLVRRSPCRCRVEPNERKLGVKTPAGSEYLENRTNAGERPLRLYRYGACIHARATGSKMSMLD